MAWKARHHVTVVHVPAVLVGEVLTDGAPRERRGRPQLWVAGGKVVAMMDAEQEGVEGLPGGRAEAHQLQHGTARTGTARTGTAWPGTAAWTGGGAEGAARGPAEAGACRGTLRRIGREDRLRR